MSIFFFFSFLSYSFFPPLAMNNKPEAMKPYILVMFTWNFESVSGSIL